ncbi:hypothetical protein HN954_02630 [bacterium]|jgi:hypothetical protein|nr:hypothetical protein [bacterium]MBT6831654.1 hypothetical protein [bacterium]MBT6996300.1 hypothetical protein [bacterium]MBT7772978.1 hypothetical protein [bacterium]
MTDLKNKIEQQQFAAEVGGELDELQHLDVFSEKVSATVGEAGAASSQHQSQTAGFDLSDVFGRISKFLPTKKTKEIKFPVETVQRRRVHRSLEREQRKLLKQVKKIQNARRFSADKLEQTIAQIRHIQKLIADLFRTAKERLEVLYRQYVLHAA